MRTEQKNQKKDNKREGVRDWGKKKREKEGEWEKGRENEKGRDRKKENKEYYRYLSSEMVLLSISIAVKSNIVVAFLNWVVSSSREDNISTPHDANDLTHMNCVSIVSAAKHITRGEKQEEREQKREEKWSIILFLLHVGVVQHWFWNVDTWRVRHFSNYQMHKKCG